MAEHASPEIDGLRLRPPRNCVERRAVGWWAVRALALTLPVLAGLGAGAALLPVLRPALVSSAVLAGVGGAVAVAVVPAVRYRVHRWEVTPEAVYTRRGWWVREWRVAPIARVQTVDSVRGPVERWFGLATVTVTTASAQGALRIPGLDRERAETLVHDLTAITQATPGDAT